MKEQIAQNEDFILGSAPVDPLPAAVVTLPQLSFAGRFASTEDVARHSHPCDELVLVTEGHCRLQVEEEWLDAPAGTLCVLPARKPQYQQTLGFTRTSYVGFSAGLHLFEPAGRALPLPRSDGTWRWIEDICDLGTFSRQDTALVGGGLLLAVLKRLDILEERRRKEAALHPDLARALQFLEENLARPVGVGELASHSHLSPPYLSALFRARFGCGPARYLQNLRMQRARALLRDPYLRVNDIARLCGYEEANYFVRLFRRMHGVPPGQWRSRPTESEEARIGQSKSEEEFPAGVNEQRESLFESALLSENGEVLALPAPETFSHRVPECKVEGDQDKRSGYDPQVG